ncbi:hypothetical protein BKI52_39665 [marine bacterium AO1-C]|nr:hypothetical protein BKI52_39665 [marine bacterium AO1-C]
MKKERLLKFDGVVLSTKQLTLVKGGQSGAPGAGVNIRVRGIGSVNAGNDPLFILDKSDN